MKDTRYCSVDVLKIPQILANLQNQRTQEVITEALENHLRGEPELGAGLYRAGPPLQEDYNIVACYLLGQL